MKFLFVTIYLLIVMPVQAWECPRIISQSPYITHTLTWLGLEQCIVGVSRYDTLDLPRTGGILDPDKQSLDTLMADIILTTNWISDDAMAKVTPDGVSYYRLNGFDSMAQIEANLVLIGKLTGLAGVKEKISQYRDDLASIKKSIDGNNKKTLLLSSCSGTPYSFGKHTWLYDLFQQMDFSMVETHDKIRHIKQGNGIEEITTLLNTFQPDILFVFERKLNSRCNLILPRVPVKIVTLDGEHFLHPAPILLKGLEELKEKQTAWH